MNLQKEEWILLCATPGGSVSGWFCGFRVTVSPQIIHMAFILVLMIYTSLWYINTRQREVPIPMTSELNHKLSFS